MSERMSDERIDEIGEYLFSLSVGLDCADSLLEEELWNALKAERDNHVAWVKMQTEICRKRGCSQIAENRTEELESAFESGLSEISRLQATLDRILSCQRYEISELDCDLVPTTRGIWMLADDVLSAMENDDDA